MLTLAVLVALAPPPKLSCSVAYAEDTETGEVLFERNADEVHAIASISKLMAMRVVLKHKIDLTAETRILKGDYLVTKKGSRSRLIVGRKYKNRDLLHAALLGSDNRAVVALGRAIGLNVKSFAKAMTEEARALGMVHTRFVEPTGIEHKNVSTGREVAKLLRAVMATPELAAVTRLATYKTEAKERYGRPLKYNNTNVLTRQEKFHVLAGKTGFNSAAGWSVTMALKLKSGRSVSVVVLGTPGKFMRFRDTRRIHNYVASLPWSKPQPDLLPASVSQ